MPILVQCACGKSFRVKDELAGRKGRCPSCKEPLVVPRPAADGELDHDALEMLLTEEARRRPAGAPPAPIETAVQREVPRPRPAPPPSKPRQPRKERLHSAQEERGSHRAPLVSALFAAGLLMMLGAVAWFVLGIVLIDRIFFYPPILFVLGFISLVKGLMGYEE